MSDPLRSPYGSMHPQTKCIMLQKFCYLLGNASTRGAPPAISPSFTTNSELHEGNNVATFGVDSRAAGYNLAHVVPRYLIGTIVRKAVNKWDHMDTAGMYVYREALKDFVDWLYLVDPDASLYNRYTSKMVKFTGKDPYHYSH